MDKLFKKWKKPKTIDGGTQTPAPHKTNFDDN